MKDLLNKEINLKEKELFLFDLDGTVYTGNRLYKGAKKLFEKIREKGGEYVFITNNSSKSVKDYIKKLTKMGVPCDKNNFFMPTEVASLFLKEKYNGKPVYVQGTKSVIKEIKSCGVNVTEKFSDEIVAVLVCYDTEFTAKKITETCKVLSLKDVPFYATNPDLACPISFGFVPDCGSICQAIENATGKDPVYLGKPNRIIVKTVMKKFNKTESQTIVIGDRLYTDIEAGINADVETVAVLTGEIKKETASKGNVKPTYLVNDIGELTETV